MSQFLVTVNDNQAESLLGGSGYTQYPSYKKPTSTIKQSVFAPIKSVAVSSADATAINIGTFNIKSPQFATATAVSEANSTVLGGIVSA
ncbi:hypothetical protein VZG28_05605 [Synechococcus elongatus IITB4]|uniref:hypothetical protein n=1 Tax=Synechococcus elongatus TaxID=32046 RepID=UPI0030D4A0DD